MTGSGQEETVSQQNFLIIIPEVSTGFFSQTLLVKKRESLD